MKKLLYLLLLTAPAFGQRFSFRPDTLASVRAGGKLLPNAWAGGLNAPQVARLRLDADTTADLVVFDRAGNRLSTFLATPQPGGGLAWRHAPQYEAQFPADLSDWMLLVDYDGDGRRDLFTRAPLGVRVFRNASTGSGPLRWEPVSDLLYSAGNSGQTNLYVAPTDIPAITDLDNDGDVDIMSFDISGNFVEFHRNESVETTGKRGLVFRKIDFCWGNFWKEHCRDFRFDVDCKTGAFLNNGRVAAPAREEATLHSGNSLLVTDLTGDGRKDVLFGHVTCTNVAFLPNTGTLREALFQRANYTFPDTQPINIQIFPALFSEDLDFDGRPDLLAAINTTVDEGDLIDYRHAALFYQNTGTASAPVLAFRQNDFLQNGMIDLGADAAPLLLDLDGDGDADLLVGYSGVRGDTGFRGGLAYYRNEGTAAKPAFVWQTDDYLGLAARFLMTEVKPFLADLNADGVPDLGFTANTLKNVEMRYLPNRGARGGAFVHTAAEALLLSRPDNLSASDTPLFYDLDADGRTDMLLGKGFQNIEYYRNVGGGEIPVFQLITTEFGGTKSDFSIRGIALSVADFDADGRPDLLTVNGEGRGQFYPDFRQYLSKPFAAADSLVLADGFNTPAARRLNGAFFPAVADLDADGRPDLLLGTGAGGVRLLRNTSAVRPTEPGTLAVGVYPNPTDRYLYLTLPTAAEAELFSLAGQLLLRRSLPAGSEQALDLGTLPNGLYLLRISGLATEPVVRKVLVER